ncbi:MAG: metal-dependent hydrolase [Candidatus Sumerlaeota bacterium]
MDALTHVLAPALITEPLSYDKFPVVAYAQWRERLTVLIAALLPDADGIFGLINLELYNRYHRVATHSVFGFLLIAFLATAIAHFWPARILPPSLRLTNEEEKWINPRFRRLLGFALLAVTLHFIGDAITAWGTLRFLWPIYPDMDFQWSLVNSLEYPLTVLTGTAWAVQHYLIFRRKKTAAWLIVPAWLLLFISWVIFRQYHGLTYT